MVFCHRNWSRMLIVDTSALLTQFEAGSNLAAVVRRAIVTEGEAPILPPPVAAELDYMVAARAGPRGSARYLQDLASGRFVIPCLEPADYATINVLNETYRDLAAGLADLSI